MLSIAFLFLCIYVPENQLHLASLIVVLTILGLPLPLQTLLGLPDDRVHIQLTTTAKGRCSYFRQLWIRSLSVFLLIIFVEPAFAQNTHSYGSHNLFFI